MKKTIKELRTLLSETEKESYRININQNKVVQYEGLKMPEELKESFNGTTVALFEKKRELGEKILKIKKALKLANAKKIGTTGKCVIDLIEENKILAELMQNATQLANVQKSTSFSKELGKQLTIEATYDLEYFDKEAKNITALIEENQKLIDEANMFIEVEIDL